MSNEIQAKREEDLEKLYSLREEFSTIAASDADYARYAREALRTLRAEGYDVKSPNTDAQTTAVHCPDCGERVDTDDAFCCHCGGELAEEVLRD